MTSFRRILSRVSPPRPLAPRAPLGPTYEELRAQTEQRLAAKEEQRAMGRELKKKRTARKRTIFE